MAARWEELKEGGNAALQSGDAAKAAALYTQAIALEPRNHLLFSNRAAALAAEGRFEDALNDAAQVVVLAPQWVKGHTRKGAALRALERYAESIAAYKLALRIEPSNAQIKASLQEVEALQRDSGRNWADDLASTDDEEAKPAKRAAKSGEKRPRAELQPTAMASQRGTPPTAAELQELQAVLDKSNAHVLRACLVQVAKRDKALCERILESLDDLGNASSDDDRDKDGSAADRSSGDVSSDADDV